MSAATAYTAHREWAKRPPDERYASIEVLHEAARARRDRTMERDIETGAFRTDAAGDDSLVLLEASGRTAALTHWSFEQLATIAGAPPKYLRSLPEPIASDAINYGLQHHRRNTSCSSTVTHRGPYTRSHHRGRDLLEARRREDDSRDRQTFYDGVQKPRDLTHDAQVYPAYLREAQRLAADDVHIHRIVLENDLKREYQEFLQERNRDREDSDGRPDREVEEVRAWALQHHLPCDEDGHVQFPDVRIECDIDGREHSLDVEVLTPYYRGAHGAAKSSAGFACYRGGAAQIGGRTGGGGRTPDPRIAEEFL
jgi:hypothetical protein